MSPTPRRNGPWPASLPRVTTLEPDAPVARTRRMTPRQARDVLALLLMVIGGVGLLAFALAWHPLAAGALLSFYAIVVGVVLGLDR